MRQGSRQTLIGGVKRSPVPASMNIDAGYLASDANHIDKLAVCQHDDKVCHLPGLRHHSFGGFNRVDDLETVDGVTARLSQPDECHPDGFTGLNGPDETGTSRTRNGGGATDDGESSVVFAETIRLTIGCAAAPF